MTVRDLINQLLDMPMDMDVAIGLPEDGTEGMKIYDVNLAELLEINMEEMPEPVPFVVIFHDGDEIDHSLN